MTTLAETLKGHTTWIRNDDPLMHIGPPQGFDLPPTSPLFQTRCGLEAKNGLWRGARGTMLDAECCPDCAEQAGLILGCANARFGPTCERAAHRDGPHRNGNLMWHDPPLIVVDGKPVQPMTVREQELLDRIGEAP